MAILGSVYALSIGWPAIFLQHDWLGWFPATMSAFLIGTVWGSVAICTSAAWLAGQVRRYRLLDWVSASAQGMQGVFLQPLVVSSGLGVLAYSFWFAYMTARTLLRSGGMIPSGTTQLTLALLIAVMSAIAWAAVGVTLGRLLRIEVAVPVAFIAAYCAYVLPAFYLFETPFLGAATTDGRSWIALQPAPFQLAARLLFWSGLAMLFAALALRVQRLLQTGAWVMLAGLSAVAFLGSTVVPIPGASERVCRGSELRACTDSAHAAALPEFLDVTSEALTVLPKQLRPTLLDDSAPAREGTLAVAPMDGFSSPAFTVDRELTLAALGEALFYGCPSDGGPRDVSAAGLDAWWRLSSGIDLSRPVTPSGAPWLSIPALASAPELAHSLAALSPADRAAWFDRHAAVVQDCKLEDIDWP